MQDEIRPAAARARTLAATLAPLLIVTGAAAPSLVLAAEADPSNAQLEERIRVLERKLELQAEDAAAKAKEASVPTAGDKGFGIKSANGQYEIRFTALAQIDGRYFLGDQGTLNDGFVARRLRPTIQGSLGKLVAFRFTPEFAGQNGVGDGGAYSSIVDAYFDLRFSPYANVRVGKQKGPIGLERLQSGGNLELIERGFVTELVPNRDIGVAVFGEAAKTTLSYTFGVFNGTADGRDVSVADDGQKEYEGRLFLEPFKNEYGFFRGLGFGVGGSTGVKNGTGANYLSRYRTPGQNVFFDETRIGAASGTTPASPVFASGVHYRVSPQAYFYRNSFGLLAEYAISEQNLRRGTNYRALENTAYNVTASYVLTGEDASFRGVRPNKPFTVGGDGWGALELVARTGALEIDGDAFLGTAATQIANINTDARKATSYGVGVNWILTQNAKITADYNYTTFEGGRAGGQDRLDERALFTRLQITY